MKTLILLAILLVLVSCPGPLFAQAAAGSVSGINFGSNEKTGRFIRIRGMDMYCEVYGTGTPVLLIHGNGGSIASMRSQAPFFLKHHRVIAADSRSQGRSKDGADSLSYEMMADDYGALLDSLHAGPAFVIGWSDGGIIGLLLAIRHPGKVRKLAATGANIRPDSSAVPFSDIQSMISQVEQLKLAPSDATTKNVIKLTRLMIDQPYISHAALQTIHCPVLVIGGDHDIIKPEHTLEIFRSIPGAKLWILPGSGHDTCIKFKDDFNEQVERFFREK